MANNGVIKTVAAGRGYFQLKPAEKRVFAVPLKSVQRLGSVTVIPFQNGAKKLESPAEQLSRLGTEASQMRLEKFLEVFRELVREPHNWCVPFVFGLLKIDANRRKLFNGLT